MTAPVRVIPEKTLHRLERFLDHFERATCPHQQDTVRVPELVAFYIQDIGCVGFWCDGCEQVHLQSGFGYFRPYCTEPGCPYRQSGCILKNCGTVARAADLCPDPGGQDDKPHNDFRSIGEVAEAVVREVAQRRKDRP